MRRATGAVRAVGLVSQGPIPGDRYELGTNHRKIVSCISSGLICLKTSPWCLTTLNGQSCSDGLVASSALLFKT